MGDRLINEHDESQEHDLQEDLYLVQRGRATFDLDGEHVDALLWWLGGEFLGTSLVAAARLGVPLWIL